MSGSSTGSNPFPLPSQRRLLGSPGPAIYLNKSYDQLLRDYEQLQGNFRATRQQLERTQIQLDEALNKATHDRTNIGRLQGRIEELEELVQKQKTTISNQSKAISDPKNMKPQTSLSTATPTRRSSHQNLFDTPHSNQRRGIFEQTPPRCDMSGSTTVTRNSRLGNSSSQQHLQPPYRPDLAPSSPLKDSFSSRPDKTTGGTMMVVEDHSAEFSSRLNSLWLKSETFANFHANVPNIYKDSHVEQKIKQNLMKISDQSSASFLLGNASTRLFLVAKVINHYLAREVLKINIIKGLYAEVDSEIRLIKQQIFPDTPPTVRNLMYNGMAKQVSEITTKPGFNELFQRRVQEHTNAVWELVGPLTHETSENAWNDLFDLVVDAHKLALRMYSGPNEFKLDFAGTNELFNPNFMVNRDSYITGDPQLLMRNHNRVKLAITPLTTFRHNATAAGNVQIVHYGHVLLRLPFKHSH